jgi:hypothetical protein
MLLINWLEFTLIVCVAVIEAKKKSSSVETRSVEKSPVDKGSVEKGSTEKNDVKNHGKDEKADKKHLKEKKVDKSNEKGNSVDNRDAKFWSTVDLRKLDVPKPVNDIGSDYVINDETEIVENSTEIDGNKMYFREAKPRGRDSGQVSIQQRNIRLVKYL